MTDRERDTTRQDKGRAHSWGWFWVGLFLGLWAVLPAVAYCIFSAGNSWRRIAGSSGYGTLVRIGVEAIVVIVVFGPPIKLGHYLGLAIVASIPGLGQLTGYYSRL